MKTITYNPETHVLVPKGMMYELPELPMPIKGKFSKDLFDGVQMHQYAMRYLDEAIAAAPQPEPNHNLCAGCSPDNCSGCVTFYEIKKQRDDLLSALEKLTDVFANIGITSGLYDDEQDALKSACAAIASVKELK